MNRKEASLYFRLRVVPNSQVAPNKAMQTDGRFATAADRQGVEAVEEVIGLHLIGSNGAPA
jgi:hypothetical protein